MLAIRAKKLIDGHQSKPVLDAVLLLDGEKIVAAGAATEVSVPDGVEIIDMGESTIIPGLIDAHVHIHASGEPADSRNYAVGMVSQTQGTMALNSFAYVQRSLKMGFTALRNVSSPAYVDVALRKAIDSGMVEGPRLKVSGQGLTVTGGHMDSRLFSPDVTIAGRTGVADGPWAFRQAAREQIKRGVDLIKINAAVSRYRMDYTHTDPFYQEMTYEEMAAVCEEAHWNDMRVAAHAHGGQGITDAIRAGLDSVEHAPWLTDEQIDMMVEKNVFYVPTLSVHTALKELGKEGIGMAPPAWNWLLHVCDARWDSLERAHKAGVKIATGTDVGFFLPHGENAMELEELVKGGLSPMESIIAATRTTAECLDMDREIGTLEAGKFADFVVLDGDPLANISILRDKEKILHVYKGGKRVN